MTTPNDRRQREGTAGPLSIRPALESDLSAINDLYNHYVRHSTSTYQEEPDSMESRFRWFRERAPGHPVTVALLNDRVAGWAALSPYHSRCAYRRTVENSVYVDPEHQRNGIGSALLQDLLSRARALGHHAVIAAIDAEQTGSIALHARFGFETVGRFKQVGFKFGRWLDVVYMELLLEGNS
jgi:L-amino acid N-acyltransferase